jgi:predicted Zn-ribbon and HTH transcriptional regulator
MIPVIKTTIRSSAHDGTAFFICKKCDHRFMAVLRILPLPVKCPECGSGNTGHDKLVVY